MLHIAYLGLGSNMGDRRANLVRGVELLSQAVRVEQLSSIYESEPEGYRDQGPFLNAVCRVAASLTPLRLLTLCKDTEVALGRVPSFRNAPRPFDVDILFYDDMVINTARLTIPHPRLAERAFVLAPLAEIAPGLVHPCSHRTALEMLSGVDPGGVRKWEEEEQHV